jgi:MFS family permease
MVGRFVGGFGIGACAIVVPAYLAEMAPPQSRGAIVQFYEVSRNKHLSTCF